MKVQTTSVTIFTIEPCPACGHPEMRIEHGARDAKSNTFVHIEHCPECGEHYPQVCYECEPCLRAEAELRRMQEVEESEE